ncbi:resolvase [Cutibacterium avidum 44067]|uniref:recombinase family protein n=1 Tax=Cutibacterium avidum TaxID=33010 RepID=UPI0002CCDE33|nr:recombinase family protein [Cutibacterium avidum]AGJ78455.1 resolvase [Cutibacterium avidum 44067]
MSPKVTTIPATKPLTHGNLGASARQVVKRVAAYARVSTDMEEQQSSYAAQVDYYTRHITTHTGWQLVRVYTDEGISGTSTKHRAGFQQMITDALSGNIDLILTKSVSRFARNTVDTLTHVRQLKEAGVEVFFEKENIWTLDSKGELLITIMSSLAQEESRSISENVTWGHRKRFADGKVMVPYASLLGDKKGKDGNLAIDETQAPIVRRIYADYLSGQSPKTIAATLTGEGVPTPRGKTRWSTTTIRSILTNEKYKGDALLQKTFTTDFLTKTTKTNEGEVPQYYVSGNHEPIIEPATWDLVQAELARRAKPGSSSTHPFASRIKCGGWYGRKTWHSTSKHRRHIWRCNSKYERSTACTTPHLSEDQIRDAFTQALATLAPPPSQEVLDAIITHTCDTTELEEQLAREALARDAVLARLNQLITTNATHAQDQDTYQHTFDQLQTDYEHYTQRFSDLETQIRQNHEKRHRIKQAHAYRTNHPNLTYTDDAWNALIDHATIHTGGTIDIHFKDGTDQTV